MYLQFDYDRSGWVDKEDPSNRNYRISWEYREDKSWIHDEFFRSTKDFNVEWLYAVNVPSNSGQPDKLFWMSGTKNTVEYPGDRDLFTSEWQVPDNAVTIQINLTVNPVTTTSNGQTVRAFAPLMQPSNYISVESGLTPDKPSDVVVSRVPDFPNQVLATVSQIKSGNANNQNVEYTEFQLLRMPTPSVLREGLPNYTITKTEKVAITEFDSSAIMWTLEDDYYYAIRARFITKGQAIGPWSDLPVDWGADACFQSQPAKPIIEKVVRETKTSISIYFTRSRLAKTIKWQRTTKPESFDLYDAWYSQNPAATEEQKEAERISLEILESPDSIPVTDFVNIEVADTLDTVYFRLQTYSDDVTLPFRSSWSDVTNYTFGSPMLAPTVWTSKPYAYLGVDESIRFYVMHNSPDNVRPGTAYIHGFHGDPANYDSFTIATRCDVLVPGTTNVLYYEFTLAPEITQEETIYWEARVTDALHDGASKWSELQSIQIYKKPELSLSITNVNDSSISMDSTESEQVIRVLPITYTSSISMGKEHKVVDYNINLISNSSYDYTDIDGSIRYVREGDVIYSKYVIQDTNLNERITPADAMIVNGMSYTLKVSATINTGATAEAETHFKTRFMESSVDVTCSLYLDRETMSMSINPVAYKTDRYDMELAENYELGIYRINDDGTMVAIAEHIPNQQSIFVTDPHPNLRDAQYRIVATPLDGFTTRIVYYDTAPYNVHCSDIIIQWDEVYYDTYIQMNSDALNRDKPVSGSMLRLHYNVDVTENSDIENNLVKYVGRKDPVAYFGTHTGYTAQWSAEIPKSDIETIRMLRRLQVYMGTVYVREPSGTGYWAMIKVSFPINHRALTVAVSIDITRVEGGA